MRFCPIYMVFAGQALNIPGVSSDRGVRSLSYSELGPGLETT